MAEYRTVFKCFLALKLEIQMFMNEKGKVLAKLSDEKWLWNLAMLCDISHHINNLNTKLKSQQKLISGMSGVVRAFEMKLKLY
jgi:hypothetical protein